jgi:Ca2+-binding EF-hand superfamily protein
MKVLRKVFDSFDHNKKGSIPSSMVRTIFTVMGHRVDDMLLKAIIQEVDADGKPVTVCPFKKLIE